MSLTVVVGTMEDSRYARPRAPKTKYGEDDSSGSFGCFGITLRGASPSRHDRDRTRKPRFDASASGTVYDPYGPTVTELKGYTIQGKSAEILGLMPKSRPVSPPKSRTSSHVPWRSISDNARPKSKDASIPSSASHTSKRQPRAPVVADPLVIVRRRLREEMSGSSNVRSSSAPAPTRNYSRKWRKSHRIATTPDRPAGSDFFDSASMDASIEEDEIPDTNKFDQALGNMNANSARIQSAAFTTFAGMQLQEEAMNLMAGSTSDHGRSSWLLDDGKSIKPVNVANKSKKRTSASAPGSAGSDFVKRDDKRDTLEWMGVSSSDFPAVVASS